ncbi:MAG: hypothetical protein QXP86_03505 [Nitrososphaerota archaeon]
MDISISMVDLVRFKNTLLFLAEWKIVGINELSKTIKISKMDFYKTLSSLINHGLVERFGRTAIV